MKTFLIALLTVFTLAAGAQQGGEPTQPGYLRFPTLPPVQLLLGDSTTMFTKADFMKGKNVLLILFSPECEHCQHEAGELVKYKDSLKNVQVVMATIYPLWQMNEFVEKYKIKALPNVVMGKDIYYFMPSFYMIHNLPYMAFYDDKGKLITTFEGTLPLPRVLETFRTGKL
jgi:thiol-disulfide isomerase/thioredoxin